MAGIRERDKWATKSRESAAGGNSVPRLFYVRNMFFSNGRYWPVPPLVAWFEFSSGLVCCVTLITASSQAPRHDCFRSETKGLVVSKFFGAGMNVLAWFERAFVLIFFSLYFGWHDQSTDGAYARPFM